AKYAERPLWGTKKDGVWNWTTYGEFHALVDKFRGGLASLGVGKGDRVAIISDNRVEWAVAAYATYGLEAEFVPMYQAQMAKEWKFILDDCAAKVVIAANDTIYDALVAMKPELSTLVHVIGLERAAGEPMSYAGLLEVGAKTPVPVRSPDPKSISGFIYTSGTTGKPKGVMLSHENIASNITGVHEVFTFEPDDRSLSFLPWAHSYGQTAEVHGLLSMGCSVAINDDLQNLIPNLAEVKPTILLAVPRIFNRIYDGVTKQIEARPGFLQAIIRGGIQGAIKRAHGEKVGAIEALELAFDERAIFAKIREKFGGRLKYAISASATLSKDVGDFIDAIGLTVYEGYGLTETSPIVSANFPGHRRLGSVGKVIPGVRVMIDTTVGTHPLQGEIIVYGPNVMVGYHNRPEENAAALMKDGGFRTGDLGYVDEDGFLYITGRIKELYKLENGKYVMPSPLEEELKLSPYIANVMIYGDGKPSNVALIVVSEEAVRKWAESESVTLGTDLTKDEKVRGLIASEIEHHSKDFKGFEKPKDFVLITEDFTTQNGMLTPTLKLKRRDVLAKYDNQIHALYKK
ncbi:MAG TPA: long-chain fatty acid--CoA ligase, partial [Polyangiaceae bacterium]